MTQAGSFPRVSVIVNTYNHERFLAQALRSVANQDFPAVERETIVVDDGSTDGTQQIASKFLPSIRYIRQCNSGQVSAFHTGVTEAKGDLLTFLDGDDWWEENKLSKVVAAFDADPSIGAIGHGYYEVDEVGAILANMVPDGPCRLSLESPERARLSAPLRTFLGTSRLAIRRSVLQRALPVPSDLPFFDNFIFAQAIAISGAKILPESLCYYRIHPASLYSGSDSQARLRTRYELLCGLLDYLPARLGRLGVPKEIISAFLECDCVDRDRLKLVLEGGTPYETYRVERSAFRIAYYNPTIGYTCFKGMVLLLALMVPPKSFYRVHDWYARHNLKRVRQWIGNASLTAPHVTRRSEKIDSRTPHA